MSLKIRKRCKRYWTYWTYLLTERILKMKNLLKNENLLTKNFTDRKSLLIVAKWFSDNLPKHFFYQNFTFNVQYTSNHQLFRTTNALTIKINLQGNIEGSTLRKPFGSHYHSIA